MLARCSGVLIIRHLFRQLICPRTFSQKSAEILPITRDYCGSGVFMTYLLRPARSLLNKFVDCTIRRQGQAIGKNTRRVSRDNFKPNAWAMMHHASGIQVSRRSTTKTFSLFFFFSLSRTVSSVSQPRVSKCGWHDNKSHGESARIFSSRSRVICYARAEKNRYKAHNKIGRIMRQSVETFFARYKPPYSGVVFLEGSSSLVCV